MGFYHSISFGCCHSVRDIVRAQQQGTQDVQLNEHTNDHYCLSPLAHINIACQHAQVQPGIEHTAYHVAFASAARPRPSELRSYQ